MDIMYMDIYDNRALAAGVVSCDGGSIQLPDVVQSSLSSRGGLRGVKSPGLCHHGLLPVSPHATLHTHTHTHTHSYTYVYVCVYVYMCMCVCMYVCIHVLYINLCIYVYVWIYDGLHPVSPHVTHMWARWQTRGGGFHPSKGLLHLYWFIPL